MKQITYIVLIITALIMGACGKDPCKQFSEKIRDCFIDICKGKPDCSFCQMILNKDKMKNTEAKCEGEIRTRHEEQLKKFTTCDADPTVSLIKKNLVNMPGCR